MERKSTRSWKARYVANCCKAYKLVNQSAILQSFIHWYMISCHWNTHLVHKSGDILRHPLLDSVPLWQLFCIVTERPLNRTNLTLFSYQQITICVAYSCLADFDRDIGYFIGGKYEGRYDFFMSVFVIGWAVVLFVFFVFLFAVESKIASEKNWNIAVSILLYFVWCADW